MRADQVSILPLGLTDLEREEVCSFNKELQMEAAMCAWEAWLELDLQTKTDWPEGAGQARTCCATLAFPIHVGWAVARYAHGNCSFDWEFVPWFMQTCVRWDTEDAYVYGNPLLMPDWLDMCRNYLKTPPTVLLKRCLDFFNAMPRHRTGADDSYQLAAEIERCLKNG